MTDTRQQPIVGAVLGLLLAGATAHAQPDPLDHRHGEELAEAIAAIANDPAIQGVDPKARPLAQALLTEAVRQLQHEAYDQALANFLAAYDKLPSPKILLDVAATLRDMARPSDAANTYQRYLADPSSEGIADVKEWLQKLDDQLTVLTLRPLPRGCELSIDGGPFLAVGSSLLTRVRPGLHLVRIRSGPTGTPSEITVNGFEGETKDVVVPLADPDAKTPLGDAPDHVDAWLDDSDRYQADLGHPPHVRVAATGAVIAPIVPRFETTDTGEVIVHASDERAISSGVVGVMRVDGKGRGFAGGLGLAYTPIDRIELELAGLKSDIWGVYAGARYRPWIGFARPYVALGVPVFFFTDDAGMSKVSVGGRAALGIELMINAHLSLAGDLGVEHFLNTNGVIYKAHTLDATLFVPTVGLIGRL